MRVGIDIDDTICQTRKTFIPYLCKHYGIKYKDVKSKEYTYFEDGFKDYYSYAIEHFDELALTLKLKPFTKKYLNKIKKRGHEIIFLTSRYYKEFKKPYETSYKYLKDNNIPFDKLIICEENKGKICLEEKIDIFFDDSYRNYKSIKDAGVEVYLMDDLPNIKIKNVNRIFTIRDMYLKVKRKEKKDGRKNNI